MSMGKIVWQVVYSIRMFGVAKPNYFIVILDCESVISLDVSRTNKSMKS